MNACTDNENESNEPFEPGAARFGNFINYYSFHPPESRLELIPTSVWESIMQESHEYEDLLCLDVGCNAGDLTVAVQEKIVASKKCVILGVDIDPVLITRANESFHNRESVYFRCMDVSSDDFLNDISIFLKLRNRSTFDITFLFSVTMWIHLNTGDEGLKQFLRTQASLSSFVVLEAQPWKCYRSAMRRMRRLNQNEFPKFNEMKIRESVETFINDFLTQQCGFKKYFESEFNSWKRKIIIFKKL